MGRKIFVSYKYGDDSVKRITSDYSRKDTVRDYVNYLEKLIGLDNIYVGEHDGEDLSEFKDSTIESHLRDKIFGSTVTVVLISKKMKDYFTTEDDQWIPWEISYSLKNPCRDGRRSSTNAIVCVVLPDVNGMYDYYITETNNRWSYDKNIDFEIIKKNRFNRIDGNEPVSYIYTCKWDYFINHMDSCIDEAVSRQENVKNYEIKKEV